MIVCDDRASTRFVHLRDEIIGTDAERAGASTYGWKKMDSVDRAVTMEEVLS